MNLSLPTCISDHYSQAVSDFTFIYSSIFGPPKTMGGHSFCQRSSESKTSTVNLLPVCLIPSLVNYPKHTLAWEECSSTCS